MLSPLENELLGLFAKELRAAFTGRLVEARLFGSRARGEGHEDSDLDVCVRIRGLVGEDRRRVQDLAANLSLDADLVLSPVVVDEVSWPSNRLRATIEREGYAL